MIIKIEQSLFYYCNSHEVIAFSFLLENKDMVFV